MVYALIGEDNISKDIKIKALKQEFLKRQLEQFNLDVLYAQELSIKSLQEKLLCLPFNAKRRVVVIRNAQKLKDEVKEFILTYIKKDIPTILLILDIDRYGIKDTFISRLARYAQIVRFKESVRLDTFTLSRSIKQQKTDYALWVLSQLLESGIKAEQILGGLRYVFEEEGTKSLEAKKRMKILLNCDIDIKTGRLKPSFALEKLVVNLCCFNKPFS